jgi:HSP20 family protein
MTMAQETAIDKRETRTIEAERMRGGQTYTPTVDILERDNELLLLADMPGVAPDSVDIQFERGLLTIHGPVAPRQDPDSTTYLLHEYGVGDFYRRFEIGEGVDPSGIEAELHAGVLTVHLPKTKEVMPRKIAVKTS